jgi:peptide/nickel transport system substrate-binding protein
MSRIPKVLRILAPLAVIFGTIGTTAASTTGRPSGAAPSAAPKVLQIAAQQAPAVIDPQFSNSYNVREIAAHAFDTLVAFNEKFAIIPDLATSWKVTGGNTIWTFTLAKGIKFQDSEKFTSADVVASLERYIKYGTGGAGFGANIDSVTAPGTYQVRITLKAPNANLTVSLANPLTFIAIMPAKYAATSTKALTPPDLIGTGPYRITAYVPNQYTELTLWKGYTPPNHLKASGYGGDRKGTIQKIRYNVILQGQTRLAGLQTGEYQYGENLPYDSAATFKSSKKLRAFLIDPNSKATMYVNHWSGPTTNVWIDRALISALNDKTVLQFIVGGNKQFYRLDSSLFYPQQKLWYDPQAGAKVYNHQNRAVVNADLAKGNYHGEPIIVLAATDIPSILTTAEAAVNQWQAMGINAQLDTMLFAQELTYLSKHDGWSLFTSGNSLRFDPDVYSSQLRPGGSLNFGFTSTQIQNLMQQGVATNNVKKRQTIYRKVQDLVWSQVPQIQFGDFMSLDGGFKTLTGYRTWYTARFWLIK